ncbi:DUF2059 domain-containing protein [Neisseria cinerea]|uniref:DUF2059 domain-containing protein n=1 Tax=Neisseria cinerea ATCC 14685 TaxID=546262 RepID=D0W1S6_NEICI|nr:DUF2059 domain-containing protein [Neisseria cinerea]EEZ72202.1 hypothetical protein NEICINOT_03603 [Neisseria cinerea ATCC 14685]MCD2070053.1 DUF2059 domain-containing protein [Neisseria cinerea]
MKLKTLLLSFASLALYAGAFAAPPSDASLERWLDTQNFDRDIEKNMINGFNAGFKPYADKALAEMPEEKKDQAAKAFNRYRENVLKDLITPEAKQAVRNTLLKNAREIYTQEEIDGMIAFYGSPVGQAVVAKNPHLIKKSMSEIAVSQTALAEKIAQHHLPEFTEELRHIICGGKNPDAGCKQAGQVGKRHQK